MDMIGGGDAQPVIDAPALAEVRRRHLARPLWAHDKPLAVEPQLWHAAETELRNALESRGWPVLSDEDTVRRGQANFLLWGVPIVMVD